MGNCVCPKKDRNIYSYSVGVLKHVPKLDFKGLLTYIQIVDVYDGDTADITFKWNDVVCRERARFFGYDSPEPKPRKHGKTSDELREIKDAGIVARDELKKILHDKVIIGDFHGRDNFGRLLVEVYFYNHTDKSSLTMADIETQFPLVESFSLSAYMIGSGFAVPYHS